MVTAPGTGSYQGRPPDPARYASWREYAQALSAYQADAAKATQGVQPEAVQLIHVDTSGTEARIVADGLMVYDPVQAGVMVAVGGVWKKVTAV